ncbi:acyl-CoA synthetase [Ideonella sp.]|uniref:LpxL/LpxP family acyltransferase n=1 Tax=Ideonella sp. TaxID=1929293 RepID=UPI002B45BE0B|nr:acyl-CoA synthetase [Ideonella sp.]HJV72172.1 acyl-CoA synthetase [Ideonella sp.]
MNAPADWSRTRERSNRFALRFIVWVALRGGRAAARALLWPITAYFLLFGGAARRHSRRFLARVLGRPPTLAEQWTHFHRFAATVLDRVYFLRDRCEGFDLQVDGAESLSHTLAGGQGAFLLGAHVGSFEALATVGRQRSGFEVAMVMYPDNAQLINAALEEIAPDFRMRIIALGQRGTTLAIRDWLDQGGLVGLLADRSLPGSGQRGKTLWLPFLGREAPFSDGPFRLAQVLRRPVFFMAGLYNGGAHYRICLEPLADFSVVPAEPAARDEQVWQAVRAYASRLESVCRESPFNWFNFHDFWQEDAAGLPGDGLPGHAGAARPRAGTD